MLFDPLDYPKTGPGSDALSTKRSRRPT